MDRLSNVLPRLFRWQWIALGLGLTQPLLSRGNGLHLGQPAYPSVSAAGGQWIALAGDLPITPVGHGLHSAGDLPIRFRGQRIALA
jgi:hypothetical protein